jgi:SAM-dependent methyltransferase
VTLYNYYLQIKPSPAGAWIQRRRAQIGWEIIRKGHPESKSLLEIGPGHGVLADIVNDAGLSYLAIESNRYIARSMVDLGHHVCRAVAPPLPIKSKSFDVVYASHVIEHLPDASTALLFLQEAHRVLKDNGSIFLSAPDMRSFGDDFWDADYTHRFPITLRRLRQLLSDANFISLREVYLSGPISGPISAFVSFFTKFIPAGLFFIPQESSERLARIRLTFLRNICVFARKG